MHTKCGVMGHSHVNSRDILYHHQADRASALWCFNAPPNFLFIGRRGNPCREPFDSPGKADDSFSVVFRKPVPTLVDCIRAPSIPFESSNPSACSSPSFGSRAPAIHDSTDRPVEGGIGPLHMVGRAATFQIEAHSMVEGSVG